MSESAADNEFNIFSELFPEVTDLNAPFWDGLTAGEVRLQQCACCNTYQYPPETFCYTCGATSLNWTTVSGSGIIYSFIVVHQPYHPAFKPFLPYTVAIVELDEGPRILGAMLGLQTRITIGDRVNPRIEAIDEKRSILLFDPST